MTYQEFLAWLLVTNLDDLQDENLRLVLEAVVESAPETVSDTVEDLLEAVEDLLDAPALSREAIAELPQRFQALLPVRLSSLERIEEEVDSRADGLSADEVASPRLTRFLKSVGQLQLTSNDATLETLRTLETEIGAAWEEYSAEPFVPEANSDQSVAGHRFLQEGFQHWFEAFDLVRVGALDDARVAAKEGNRLFTAVALWSVDVGAQAANATPGPADA